MNNMKFIVLYGSAGAMQQAKGILENQPFIRRIDTMENKTALRLILSRPMKDEDFIALLHDSGLDGIQIDSGN